MMSCITAEWASLDANIHEIRVQAMCSRDVYQCLNSLPRWQSMQRVTEVQSRRRLRSSSSSTMVVPVTRRATLGDRSFPVAATRTYNAIPDFVTAAPIVSSSAALKTDLFSPGASIPQIWAQNWVHSLLPSPPSPSFSPSPSPLPFP